LAQGISSKFGTPFNGLLHELQRVLGLAIMVFMTLRAVLLLSLVFARALTAHASHGTYNKAVIKSYFDGVFLSGDFKLDKWLDDHVAGDGVFQFCPLTAVNVPSSLYPHCTDAKGKKAYLAYVEKDQSEFGNTRIANISYGLSEDGLEVFSRYMVTGTLEGKPVPWFDQMMAWNFNPDGKITKTVFWSDTLYWHVLYDKYSAPPALVGTDNSSWATDSTLVQVFVVGLVFVSGIWVGRRSEARQADKEMQYYQYMHIS